MTRITTFQVAGILVAALMCFSEVCYVNSQTTAGPTTMTDVTTAAPETTTVPATTTGPTTTTGPATTTASNMTTTFSNMTTTASNMTTTASNMTTTFSNMTTTFSNMTTAASNMTTENGTTSTTPSVTTGGTTPAPEVRWKVKDKNGKLCMLMDFGGSITDLIKGVTVQIPSDASTSRSGCSTSYSVFALNFNTPTAGYGIEMNFTARGGSFELHTLAAFMASASSSYSSSETGDFFDVPLGDYYTCSHFNYTLGLFQLNFTNPSLQPFVQKTEGGDNMGKPYDCRTDHSESHIGIIVGVVVGVIVIIAVIVVTFVVVKRRRNPPPPSYVKA